MDWYDTGMLVTFFLVTPFLWIKLKIWSDFFGEMYEEICLLYYGFGIMIGAVLSLAWPAIIPLAIIYYIMKRFVP